MDHVILNHCQVTAMTPELAPPPLTTTPHQREDVSALDRFNVHRCPTWRVFSGTGLELVTRQATVRYLYYSATTAKQPTPNGIFPLTSRHLAMTLMSAHGFNIKQFAFTPLDSQVISSQQLLMDLAPGRCHVLVPWLTKPEGTVL
ncbi:uncharacterized protein TNCV_1581351 [Trichonephila clavipes]|nr:uncharacterized protein TNCV_1581351 [Trichonephila clavipes]